MWRNFAALLLLLNAAAAAYAWFNPSPLPARPLAVDADIPALVLLDERSDSDLQSAGAVVAARLGAAPSPDQGVVPSEVLEPVGAVNSDQRCAAFGPFEKRSDANAWLRAVEGRLSVHKIQQKEEMVARGFWVYLTPNSDREAALTQSRKLAAAGVRDYYVVTAGENENSISLGVFRDAINADKRVAQVQALGFYPKRVERGDPTQRFFVAAKYPAEAQLLLERELTAVQRGDRISCLGLG